MYYGWLLALIACIPADEVTDSWTRFRGPNGSGHGSGLTLPSEFNEQFIRWKVPLPGVGHGSPVVCQGRIYLQASENQGSERLIFCLDATSGKILWKRSILGKRAAAMHQKNSLASGTAATDGERVFFCHWDGQTVQLAAYSCTDGKPLWTFPLGKHVSQHGAGYSPILAQGRVIVAYDADNHAEVFCIDAATGEKRWSQPRKNFRACYSTPLIRTGKPQDELIVTSTAGISAYSLFDGRKTWEMDWPFAGKPLRSVSSPVLCENDILLAACGDGGGDRDTIALQLPAGDISQDREPRLIWQLRRDIPYVTCLLEHQQHIYYVADKGVAGCLDLQTGKECWAQRLSGNFTSSPLIIDNHIFAVNENGELFIFDANAEKYHLRGRLKLNEDVLATPALANGCLYIRGKQHLFCLGASK